MHPVRMFPLLAILAMLVATGCTTTTSTRSGDYTGSHQMKRWLPIGRHHPGTSLSVEFPEAGAALDPGFWDSARAVEGDDPIIHERSTILPYLTYRKYHAEVAPDRRSAEVRAYRMWYLGIPGFYLPLYFHTSKHRYEHGSETPTGSTKRHYTPLFSGSDSEGAPGDDPTLRAGGIPFLFEGGRESGRAFHFDDAQLRMEATHDDKFWTTLWWLGPAYAHRQTTETKAEGVHATQTKAFVPLFLGKTLGPVVWSHYTTTTTAPGGAVTTMRGHGPVFGLLTAFEREYTAPGESRTLSRLILGGLLWSDFERGSHETGDYASRRGLLWGGFGYGRATDDEGLKRQIRFLWLPIKLGRVHPPAAAE